jgi:hypothetical protein
MSVRHKVLLIDTGDPLLSAVENATRDLGHFIYSHPSPVGVGQALAQYDADVVLLFWDQPAEQDRKLKTLIESWERFRPLKTVVFSRTRAKELPAVLAGAGDRSVCHGSWASPHASSKPSTRRRERAATSLRACAAV